MTCSFNGYQSQAFEFAVYKDRMYPIAGLSEEVGEVCALFAKALRKHGEVDVVDPQKLQDELSDVLWMLAAVATEFGLSLQTIADHNLDKLERRREKDEIVER